MALLYATIANSTQAEVCDNRLCDNRSYAVQESMDRDRVIAWMKERGLNNRKLAELMGVSEDKVSKSLATTGKPRRWQGAEVLKLMELMSREGPLVRTEVRGTGMTEQQAREAWALQGDKVKPVPLVGSAWGGQFDEFEDVDTTELRLSEVLDYLARPPSLAEDPEAYAVEIVGESMSPRFEPGEYAFVSPKAPVRIGDDVIVQLRAPEREGSDIAGQVTEVLIKRLVKRSPTFLDLRQFNPDKVFRVPLARVQHLHRVRGRL
jgi:phage repressor protein C with HTH and peptisase S24 domain